MNSKRFGHFTAGRLATVAALCCVAGCSEQTSPIAVPAEQDRVELALVDRAAFDAVLARLRGKVVLVDCWATWCAPCVEQLPHSIELAKQHSATGLAVVTLNFDDPDATEEVRAALARAGGGIEQVTNLQTTLGSSSEAMDAFEITSGALPHYKLLDREGKLRQVFELDPAAKTQFTPAVIDAAIGKMLAE
jgi:thiol-disulfide isomerase/thioredoxin